MLTIKKTSNSIAITIPPGIAEKLALKEGAVVEAVVNKGKLLILKKTDKTSKIMQYAGLWDGEDTDKVFGELRKDWRKWQKNLRA